MRKLCKTCNSTNIHNQIKTGTCKICSKVIVSVVTPVDSLCIDCSIKYNKCIRCGKNMQK